MRKLILGSLIALSFTTSSHADEWRNRRPEYQGGGGNNWVVPLIGGMIIGGAIMAAPRYNDPPPPGYYDDQQCQRVVVGRWWNGYRWIYRTEVVCN